MQMRKFLNRAWCDPRRVTVREYYLNAAYLKTGLLLLAIVSALRGR